MPTSAQRQVIDPILSNVVQGYKHPEHIGHALFPRVPVESSGGQVIEFNKNSFRLYKTARAPGTPFQRIQFGYLGKPYAVENHGVEAAVPREHMRDASIVPGIDLASGAISGVMSVNSLVMEKQHADIARNAASYDANHKVTLAGTDQWNDYVNSDPVKDINDAREAIRSSTGVYPNVISIPSAVFDILCEHPKITDKIKYTQTAIVTEQLLAAALKADKVVVGKAIGFDDADASIDFWGKDVVLAYVPSVISGAQEPSYGYTYTLTGHPNVEVPYWDNSTKSWVYGIGYERVPVLSGITSGFLIINAIA